MICPQCGIETTAGAKFCNRCGAILESVELAEPARTISQSAQEASQPAPTTGFAPPAFQQAPNSGMAIASLVLGITSFCTCVTGIPAIILGFYALSEINRSQGMLRGRGMGIAGIITGITGTLFYIIYLIVMFALGALSAIFEQ